MVMSGLLYTKRSHIEAKNVQIFARKDGNIFSYSLTSIFSLNISVTNSLGSENMVL